jgi:hypothetical protein
MEERVPAWECGACEESNEVCTAAIMLLERGSSLILSTFKLCCPFGWSISYFRIEKKLVGSLTSRMLSWQCPIHVSLWLGGDLVLSMN